MKSRHKRALVVLAALGCLGIATTFVINALDSNVAFFYTPTQVAAGEAPRGHTFRVGGMVLAGSMKREGMQIRFVVTDTAKETPVIYQGILPDLFREGKGAVVQGRLNADGIFEASEVLAKHDENYMPPEAKHAIDAAHTAKTVKVPK